MLRCASYDVVFSEIPGEVTLALNLSNCPNRCPGCHSPHLREDIGQPLDEETLLWLLGVYGNSVTCVCFMGGDAGQEEVARCALFVKRHAPAGMKTAWYSGCDRWPEAAEKGGFDYVKIGSWRQESGALDDPRTNQRLYRLQDAGREDITHLFWKNRKKTN